VPACARHRLVADLQRLPRCLGVVSPLEQVGVGGEGDGRVGVSEAGVRRRFLRHPVVSGHAAAQRRDFELMLVRYAPDVVFEADAGLQTLGVPASAQGRAEMARVVVEVQDGRGACTARGAASSSRTSLRSC